MSTHISIPLRGKAANTSSFGIACSSRLVEEDSYSDVEEIEEYNESEHSSMKEYGTVKA